LLQELSKKSNRLCSGFVPYILSSADKGVQTGIFLCSSKD
jgi:hypothetical protein